MFSVASLLNQPTECGQPMTPTSTNEYTPECSPAPSEQPSKKPKLAKDAAVFQKSKVTGQVRYSPYETKDSKILEELERLNVYPLPLAKITDFPRHIPYNSDKKQLYQKTGRDAFEVFQYTFQPTGHDRPYAVLWDYNIGLVRMTPFFKCNRYPKTVPSKMLNLNPGLREISHSITGGALVAQGYWIPYDAAKALASTFCWEFRYALVPVFGPGFPDMCARPGSDAYSTMIIDESIIRKSTQDVELFRSMNYKPDVVKIDNHVVETVRSPAGQKTWDDTSKFRPSFRPINRPTSMPIEAPIESSYPFVRTPGQTPQSSCLSSPAMSSLNSIGTPASLHRNSRLQSPNEILEGRNRIVMSPSPSPYSSESSASDISPKTIPRKRRYQDIEQMQAHQKLNERDLLINGRRVSEADLEAASILVDLQMSHR